MPTLEKQTTIDEIKGKIDSAKMAILTEFQGLNVAEMTELRKVLRKAEIDYKVYKNTLVRLAAEQLGLTGIEKYLVGTTALAIIKKDELASPAKLLKDFSTKHQNLKVKGGILNYKVISFDDVNSLINMPPREVVISMVLGGMQAPLTKLMGVLQAPLRDFMSVLKNLADKKEKGTGETPVPSNNQETESNIEENKVEEVKVEEVKVEESKVEESKVEESNVEESKVEEGSSDQQTAENQ